MLREKGKWSVSDPGLNRSLELARAKQAGDSTKAKAQQPQVQIMPAPNGPPVQGGAAAPSGPPAAAPR